MPDFVKIIAWPPQHAKKAYEDGYYIEALQTLHGWIEVKLRELLLMQRPMFTDDADDFWGKAWDTTNELSLNNIVKTLFTIGVIPYSLYQQVMHFNKVRNNITHKLFFDPYEKEYKGVPKLDYDKAFNEGLGLAEHIEKRITEVID